MQSIWIIESYYFLCNLLIWSHISHLILSLTKSFNHRMLYVITKALLLHNIGLRLRKLKHTGSAVHKFQDASDWRTWCSFPLQLLGPGHIHNIGNQAIWCLGFRCGSLGTSTTMLLSFSLLLLCEAGSALC